MAGAIVQQNAAGDYALGVTVDGVFIPIASVAATRVEHLVERDADLKAKVKAGGEGAVEAQEVLENDFGGKAAKANEKEASS